MLCCRTKLINVVENNSDIVCNTNPTYQRTFEIPQDVQQLGKEKNLATGKF